MPKSFAFGSFALLTPDDALLKLNSAATGLSATEAHERLHQYGLNQLSAQTQHWYEILLNQFKSPFLYVLIAATVLSAFLHETADAILILVFIAINTLLGFYQEYRSEKALQLLKQFVVPLARVKRDGKVQNCATRELVPGDIIVIHAGDILPADVRFLSVDELNINESVLTGETSSVLKTASALHQTPSQMYQAKNIGFAGTHVVTGEAQGLVLATGKSTSIGAITKLTVETHHQSTFERSIAKLSNFILKLIVATLIFITLINIMIKGPSANIPEIIIFAIALAISVVPEALPVVTTFSLSKGALDLAKHKVVVKRLASIEDFGSIEILCTDKTGTITENKMAVSQVFPLKSDAVRLAALASTVSSYRQLPSDSFDQALLASLSYPDHQHLNEYQRLETIPFDPHRRCNSVLLRHGNDYQVIVRGALEQVLEKSTHVSQEIRRSFEKWAVQEGQTGKRVIAIAEAHFDKAPAQPLAQLEKQVKMVGAISFLDPLKKTASAAVKEANALGVQLKILTGDSPDVAGYIAEQVGLIKNSHEVITGEAFEQLSINLQQQAVLDHHVFARVSPEQKFKVVQFLQQQAEVGFLGDGINDAPALKVADIGIVVEGASDIAREAADIILLNQSLHVIINGIKEGRQIFSNTSKYIKATLASNFGNFYTIALISLFIPFLPLLPLQILLINLLTDFPMISIATDKVDGEELRRPHTYDIKGIALIATVMGLVSSVFDFVFFALFQKQGAGVLQTNWFIFSIWTELVFVLSMRSRKSILKSGLPSKPMLGLSLIAFMAALVIPMLSFGQRIFQFVSPTVVQLSIISLLTILYVIVNEVVKASYYQFTTAHTASATT